MSYGKLVAIINPLGDVPDGLGTKLILDGVLGQPLQLGDMFLNLKIGLGICH